MAGPFLCLSEAAGRIRSEALPQYSSWAQGPNGQRRSENKAPRDHRQRNQRGCASARRRQSALVLRKSVLTPKRRALEGHIKTENEVLHRKLPAQTIWRHQIA